MTTLVRSNLTDIREKRYEDQNRGIYMFRLDDERVVDATMTGGVARYINHSCDPNCVTETVELADTHIIIFAARRIESGEELSYDYKVSDRDGQSNISLIIILLSLTSRTTTRFPACVERRIVENG